MLIFLPDMSSLSHDSSIGLLEFLGFPLGSLWEHFSDIGVPLEPLGHYFGDFGTIWIPKYQYFLINTPKYQYIHIFI